MSTRQYGFRVDVRANIDALAFYFVFYVRSFGPAYLLEFGRAL
jgi:hypothetical protein